MTDQEPIPNREKIIAYWHARIVENQAAEITLKDLVSLARDIKHLETGIDPDRQPGVLSVTRYPFSNGFYELSYQAAESSDRPVFGSKKGCIVEYLDNTGRPLEIHEIRYPTTTTFDAFDTFSKGISVNPSAADRRFWATNIWRMYEEGHGLETP